jgi:hypothetical protein
MNIIGYDISNSALMFVTDEGKPYSVDGTHPNYGKIREQLLSNGNGDEIVALADSRVLIQGKTFGLVTVGNDAVWYKTTQLNGWLIDKLLAMLGEQIDVTPWANLLDNLMRNPDPRVHERLPLFLEQANMPITPDGHFLSWRLVKEDYWDINTGNTFQNTPGAVLQMPRENCDPDPHQTCSRGIHIAAFGYLGSYGFFQDGNRCMLVKTNPEHVVAVPADYSNQKLRTCETLILREVEKSLVPALYSRGDHVTDVNGHTEDDPEFEGTEEGDEGFGFDYVETKYPAKRKPKKAKAKSHLPPYYVENEGKFWGVYNRKTGKLRRKAESRDKAREYAKKLNRR